METNEFHRKSKVDYSLQNICDVVAAGNALVKSAGSLDGALCQSQEHEFRKQEEQLEFVRDNARWIPSVAEEMMEVLRVGVTASYSRPSPSLPRRKGLPYRSKDAEGVLQNLRPDVSKGRIFVCGSVAVGGDASDIEATPSTLVLKRNPDRSWSTEKSNSGFKTSESVFR